MNPNRRAEGPVLVEIRPALRRTLPPPKQGEKYVALVAGGAEAMFRMVTEHLSRFRPVEARYHWGKPKEFDKPIPPDVDLVIILTSYIGHARQDAVIETARNAGVPYVLGPHKWSELSKRLDTIGVPNPMTGKAPPLEAPVAPSLKPIQLAPPPKKRIVLTQQKAPVLVSTSEVAKPPEDEAQKRREQEEFEREFARLLAEEEAERAKQQEFPALPALGPLSCVFEANPESPSACRHCGMGSEHELHSEERRKAAQEHFAEKLAQQTGKAPKKAAKPEPGVDELVRALAKAMKRERVEKVTIEFSEQGKASVTIVEQPAEE